MQIYKKITVLKQKNLLIFKSIFAWFAKFTLKQIGVSPQILIIVVALFMTSFIIYALPASINIWAQMSGSGDVDVSAVVPAVGGGGSTGSGSSTPAASVSLSGTAFPNAKLTVLRDGAVATSLIANPDGSFVISLNNLNFGNYQLTIFAEDPSGVISSSHVLNVSLINTQPISFANIVIPPTMSSTHLVVAMGQQYVLFGYAPAGSTVEVTRFGGGSLGVTTADGNGLWQLPLVGSSLLGLQTLRAQATLNGFSSLFSRPISILFAELGQQPPPPPQLAGCVDYNKDKRINLIDFSILLFWFGKDNPPPTIDCNRDNRIDIKDFSILMFFWTG